MTAGNDTLFEEMVQDFEAIERDPNKNVDEQEETIGGTKIPQSILDDASEMFGKDSSLPFEEIVNRILDVPIHKDWFEKEYHGNEFDLKQELEAIISESKSNEQEVKEMALSGDKYIVTAQSFNRKTGEKVGKQRDEEVDISSNVLFKQAKSIGDLETAYESFWNDLNPDSENIVKVSAIRPVSGNTEESKTNEDAPNWPEEEKSDEEKEEDLHAEAEERGDREVDRSGGAQSDYDAAIGSLVAKVSEFAGHEVSDRGIEMVLHHLVVSGGAAGFAEAVKAYGNLRAEMDSGRQRTEAKEVKESKMKKPFNLRDIWELKERDVLGSISEQEEEVKEDTKGFIDAGTARALIGAWELIGTHDDDPSVRSMADEKVHEFVHMLSVGLEDPDRNEEVDEDKVKEEKVNEQIGGEMIGPIDIEPEDFDIVADTLDPLGDIDPELAEAEGQASVTIVITDGKRFMGVDPQGYDYARYKTDVYDSAQAVMDAAKLEGEWERKRTAGV